MGIGNIFHRGKYDTASWTEEAGVQQTQFTFTLSRFLCLHLSSVIWIRECLIVFNYVYEAQDSSQHLLYCLLGLHIALTGY